MLKSTTLGAALIAVLTPVISTLLALPATAANTWVQASTSKLLTTTETSNVIGNIANVKTPMLIAGFSKDTWGVGAKVAVYNLNYDGHKFTGQVLNNTGKTIKYLQVNYEVIDVQRQLIDTGTVYVNEDTLEPFQNGTFWGNTQSIGTNLVIKSTEWLGN